MNHWIIESLNHWIIESLSHWIIESLSHWVIESLNHWVIESLNHWIIESLNHWIIESLSHWIIESLSHWVIESLSHWVIESLNHWVIESLNHWVIESLNHGVIESLNHWVIESLNHWIIESLSHWIIESLSHWVIESLSHWVIESLSHWVIESLNHWVIESLNHWVIESSSPFLRSFLHSLGCPAWPCYAMAAHLHRSGYRCGQTNLSRGVVAELKSWKPQEKRRKEMPGIVKCMKSKVSKVKVAEICNSGFIWRCPMCTAEARTMTWPQKRGCFKWHEWLAVESMESMAWELHQWDVWRNGMEESYFPWTSMNSIHIYVTYIIYPLPWWSGGKGENMWTFGARIVGQ